LIDFWLNQDNEIVPESSQAPFTFSPSPAPEPVIPASQTSENAFEATSIFSQSLPSHFASLPSQFPSQFFTSPSPIQAPPPEHSDSFPGSSGMMQDVNHSAPGPPGVVQSIGDSEDESGAVSSSTVSSSVPGPHWFTPAKPDPAKAKKTRVSGK